MSSCRRVAIGPGLGQLLDGDLGAVARELVQAGHITGGVDRGQQVGRPEPRRVEADGGSLGRQVDLGDVDAVDLLEKARDPVDAGRAGHALDGERDDLDGRGGGGGGGHGSGVIVREDTPREYPRTRTTGLSRDQ